MLRVSPTSPSKNRRAVSALFVVFAACALAIQSLAAEQQRLCHPRRYISDKPATALNQLKALDALNSIRPSGRPGMQITAVLDQVDSMLLAEPGASNKDTPVDCKMLTLCSEARQERREALREGRRLLANNIMVARLPSCDPDHLVQPSLFPNDPSFSQLWGMHQASDIDIDAPEAWDYSTGSNNVVVAVIDTGIDHNHPDLTDNMWRNPGEIPGNGIDDDGNGYVDDVYGWDFWNGDNSVYDTSQGDTHGTHVAGTIGAKGNNQVGVVGVNWNVKMIALKFLGPQGGYTSGAVQALNYLTKLKNDHGINVIASNNSWGGGGFSTSLNNAIIANRNAGILFVAAAGNGGSDGIGDNNDVTPHYPSNYNVENVVSVAALASGGNLTGFSNYGINTVHIAAPGASILSTLPGNTYGSYSGTSMATPHVTGAIALLKAYEPSLTMSQLRSNLLDNATVLTSLNGKVNGSRFLNAYRMLSEVTPPPGPFTVSGVIRMRIGGNLQTIAGAVVRIQIGNFIGEAITGADGSYRFNQTIPEAGDYVLTVRFGGYEQSVTGRIRGDIEVNLEINEQASELKGVIRTTAFVPVANAIVYSGVVGQIWTATDRNGVFRFNLPLGTNYSISALAPGYIIDTAYLEGELNGPTERVVVALTDPYSGEGLSGGGMWAGANSTERVKVMLR